MAFYEDAEIEQDKRSVKQWKDQFDNIIVDANKYIDLITAQRYGDLSKFSNHINLLKSHMEALKVKYNIPAVDSEIDGFITNVDSQISTIVNRWDSEVYNKING